MSHKFKKVNQSKSFMWNSIVEKLQSILNKVSEDVHRINGTLFIENIENIAQTYLF